MPSRESVRRRAVLAGGAALLASTAGCSALVNQRQSSQRAVPPLVEVAVTNQTRRTQRLYLLVQGDDGEVTYWKEGDLSAAPEAGETARSWVVQFPPCYSEFRVSVSIDAGKTWQQIGPVDYRQSYEDFPENQGCSPEAVIHEGEAIEFETRLSVYEGEKCANNSSTIYS